MMKIGLTGEKFICEQINKFIEEKKFNEVKVLVNELKDIKNFTKFLKKLMLLINEEDNEEILSILEFMIKSKKFNENSPGNYIRKNFI